MPRDRFEDLVSAALDDVPSDLAALIDNCVILVEDEPPPEAPETSTVSSSAWMPAIFSCMA